MFANLGKKIRAKFNRAVVAGATALGVAAALPAGAAPGDTIVGPQIVEKPTVVGMATGSFYMTGTPGTFTLTAPPTPDGDDVGFYASAGQTNFGVLPSYNSGSVGVLGGRSPYTELSLDRGGPNQTRTVYQGNWFQIIASGTQAGDGNGGALGELGSATHQSIDMGDGTIFERYELRRDVYQLTVSPGASVDFSWVFDAQSDIACTSPVSGPQCFSSIGGLVRLHDSTGTPLQDVMLVNLNNTTAGFHSGHFEGDFTLSNSSLEPIPYLLGFATVVRSSIYPSAVLGGNNQIIGTYNQMSMVPEPSAALMFGAGLAGVAGAVGVARRRREGLAAVPTPS